MRQPPEPDGCFIDLIYIFDGELLADLRTAKSIESRLKRLHSGASTLLQRYAADICRRDMRAILDQFNR